MFHSHNTSLEILTQEFEGVVYTEMWLPIQFPVSLNGKYQISSFGRLKRSKKYVTKKGEWLPEKIIKPSGGRYLRFSRQGSQYKNGRFGISMHRLVGLHYIPNPENKPQINHKDTIKWNNFYLNLEWCTQSENICHAQSMGIMKYAKPKPPKKKPGRPKGCDGTKHFKKVIDISNGKIYPSMDAVGEMSGIKKRRLQRMLDGTRINHTSYRYFVKGEISTNVILPPPPKPIKIKPPKIIRERKVYVPHPLPTKNLIMSDVAGNKITVFKSVRSAAEHMKSKKKTFIRQVKKSPRGYYKGFLFKYAS